MNNPAQNSNWLSDPAGRIKNISLAPSGKNAMIPLFETIMNSIHAIEERFGKNKFGEGKIDVEIMRDENGGTIGFIVTDNGVGFNDVNLESFKKMDSQKKATLGGKGVGRLLWLKVIEKVRINSMFSKDEKCMNLTFDFTAEYPLSNMQLTDGVDSSKTGTQVDLYPYRSVYATCLPKKSITIANRVLAHFIKYFVNISHPKITIIDGKKSIDLLEQFLNSIKRDKNYKFEVQIANEQKSFTLHCFLLPKAISDDEVSINALYLGANGRAVERVDLDKQLGFKAIEGNLAFLGYVESEVLDDSVIDSRTSFSLDKKEIKEIINGARSRIWEFLDPEVQQVRIRQKKVVLAVRKEHPRFLSIVKNIDDLVKNLRLATQTEEEIFLELSRKSLRQYKKRKSDYNESRTKKNLNDITKKAADLVSGLRAESISSLAEYVTRRKLILEVFEDSLKYTDNDEKKSSYEEVIHNIICPMKTNKEDLNYEDHNLWILDDRLAFYTYFNSDQNLGKQLKNPDSPLDRPDITAFDIFGEGLGFQQDESQPITIIEFKRPKRDDYTYDKNPINQVKDYVEEMRKAKEVTKYDGTSLRTIDDNTPFHCHIITDITPSLRKMMDRTGGFHQKAGTGCYYQWDSTFKIFIEISSFAEVLKSAKARNQIFFEKVGL